jgi:hypothetical protein
MLGEEYITMLNSGVNPSQLMKRNNFDGLVMSIIAGAILIGANTNTGASSSFLLFPPPQARRVLQTTAPNYYDQSTTIELPEYLSNTVDVWDIVEPTDQLFFYYIARAGGLTWQKICAECLALVSASSRGLASGNVSYDMRFIYYLMVGAYEYDFACACCLAYAHANRLVLSHFLF